MLQPTRVTVSRKLRPKRLTGGELSELIALAIDGASRVITSAEWRGGEQTRSTDVTKLVEVHRPHDLIKMDLLVFYPDDSALDFELIGTFDQSAEASTGTALARAHQIESRYSAIPTRRAALLVARALLWASLLVGVLVCWSLLSRLIDLNSLPFPVSVSIMGIFLAVVAVVAWLTASRVWELAPSRTSVIPIDLSWFRNPAIMVSLFGASATAVTATVAAITLLTR